MTERARPSGAIGRIDWYVQILIAALCLAEAAIVWLIATAIVSAPESSAADIPLWLVFALLWSAALLPSALDALDVWDPWYRVALSASFATSLAIAVKLVSLPAISWRSSDWLAEAGASLILRASVVEVSAWAPIALAVYAWWRGRTRAAPSLDAAFRLLRTGAAVALGAAGALAAAGAGDGSSAGAVTLFIVVSLIAIGIACLKQGDGERSEPVTLRSVLVALSPVILVFGLGLLLAGLLNRELLETVIWALGPLIWALGVVARAIVFAIAVTALLLLTPVFWLLEGHRFNPRPIRFDGSASIRHDIIGEASRRANETPDLIRYAVAAMLLLWLFSAVTRFMLRRRKRRSTVRTAEERATIRPVFDVERWLAAILDALGRQVDRGEDDPLTGLRRDPRWAATVRVRERYRAFLVWSGERGYPRAPGMTPAEHGAKLKRALAGPIARDDVDAIAAIYARARYSDRPAAESDATAIDSAWRRLERAGRAER